jgi:hypothetical protein
VVAWHQDYSYWTRTKPMAHLTCWTGLDDADTQNGCMYYVPGSHRWGLLDKPALAGDMDGIMGYLSEDQKREFKPVPIELKAGYSAFPPPAAAARLLRQPHRPFPPGVRAQRVQGRRAVRHR